MIIVLFIVCIKYAKNVWMLYIHFCFKNLFLCPRHSKNGGGALSVTPVHASVRSSVRSFVRSSVRPKFGVRSVTFERLHRFNSNLLYWYIISKHRPSLIWVTIHKFLTELWVFYRNIVNALSGVIRILWTHF